MSASFTFVLVHGAFADHHAFDIVKPQLEGRGHTVFAPDLPGHGDDRTPISAITLDAYVDAIGAVVQSAASPVILVGHSMAGMVVSAVAERLPDRIQRLVYVAAYLPKSGQDLQQLAEQDPTSLVGQHMQFAPDWSTVMIDPAFVVEAIAADLPSAVQELVRTGQRPEALAPFQGTVTLTDCAFRRIPKSYLHTTNDRAVTPSLQAMMVAAYPSLRRAELATGHLPFLAQPDAFVTTLEALAAR